MSTETKQQVTMVPVGAIKKIHNPRQSFDKAADAELEASVKAHGIIQPLVGRRNGDGIELVCGERRLLAAKAAGLTEVRMTVHEEMSDEQADQFRLVENIQRADVHPLEEAEAFERLAKTYKKTPGDIAAQVGKPVSYVVQRMKLLTLTAKCREAFRKGVVAARQRFRR